jgi:anthranilate/para-aminobenzoate synthase component I
MALTTLPYELPHLGSISHYCASGHNLAKFIGDLTSKFIKHQGFMRLEQNGISFLFLEPFRRITYPEPIAMPHICSPSTSASRTSYLAENSGTESIPHFAGWISYEYGYKNLLINSQKIREKSNLTKIPYYCFYEYQTVIKADYKINKITISRLSEGFSSPNRRNPPMWLADEDFRIISQKFIKSLTNSSLKQKASDEINLISTSKNFERQILSHATKSQKQYIEDIKHIKEEILCGEVYQVNLSNQFNIPINSSALQICLDNLSETWNPELKSAPYGALGRFSLFCEESSYNPESFIVLSLSPELMISTKYDGLSLLASSRPIKGTRPRGQTVLDDTYLINSLLTSSKDAAELAMIVDLVRNDFNRAAELGSVKVANHKTLESYPTVHHLVSTIQGVLGNKDHLIPLITSLFPFGSITGAPKKAAIDAISRYESTARGIWTGTIGMIGYDGTCQFNVAIRTAHIFHNQFIFNSGGAITIDSIPEDEYVETLIKARCWAPILKNLII